MWLQFTQCRTARLASWVVGTHITSPNNSHRQQIGQQNNDNRCHTNSANKNISTRHPQIEITSEWMNFRFQFELTHKNNFPFHDNLDSLMNIWKMTIRSMTFFLMMFASNLSTTTVPPYLWILAIIVEFEPILYITGREKKHTKMSIQKRAENCSSLAQNIDITHNKNFATKTDITATI